MRFCVIIFAFIFHFLCADTNTRIGKLDNGLTYYIQHNAFPKEKAALRLVVKVGSIYETEEEMGVAHFLEHMLFRGSQHFADWEIIHYLESIGAKLGPDTNAYTTFEETCYFLQVPLEKKENLEQAILILSDFAGRATLQDEVIEKERTVIMDEYNRSQKQSSSRIFNQIHGRFFKESAYYDRMAIGKKEVILGCSPKIIQNFYKKWYKPNRMAVIAVGDFDTDLVEARIRQCFDDLSSGDGEIISTEVAFPNEVSSVFMVDAEEMFVQGGFLQFYEQSCPKQISKEEIRKGMIYSIVSSILNDRFEALSNAYPAPFLTAGIFSSSFTTFHKALRIHYIGFMSRPLDGIRALYREVERLKQFGPTENEWVREISQIEEEIAIEKENLDRIDNTAFAEVYHDEFICGMVWNFLGGDYEIRKEILNTIQPQDVSIWMQENIHLEDMHRIFSMPFSNMISLGDVDKVLNDLREEKLEPPLKDRDVVLDVKQGANVEIASAFFDSVGAKEIVLKNGIKVILHPTALEKGSVSIELVASHGKTLFEESEYASLSLASRYLMESGLGNLNGIDLKNFLKKRNAHISINVGLNSRSIYASAPTNQSETLFQVIQALFLEKRYAPTIWSSLFEQFSEVEKYQNHRPVNFFIEEANRVIYDNHPFYLSGKMGDADEEIAKRCMQKAFQDPFEFSLVVVGDFDLEEMEELVTRYLAFPEKVKREDQKVNLPFLDTVVESQNIILHQGKETHGMTLLGYRKNCQVVTPSALNMKVLSYILEERCMKKMRHEMGDTYSVSVLYEFPLEPFTESVVAFIYFTSSPEKADSLKQIADEVVVKFIKEGPTEQEIATAKKIIQQRIKEAKETDSFWQYLHVLSILESKPIETLLLERESLATIQRKSIQALAKEIFEDTPVIRLSLFPE